MPVTHEPWLVVLSIVVAIQGAYVGLSLAVQIDDAVGMRRRLLLAGAAFSLAVAIWAMHFVGMLAARLPFPVDYLVFPTLLSFLVCVIVVGAAVFATSSGPLTWLRLTLSACLMGARHLHDALHRHGGAARERPHDSRARLCCVEPGGRDRGVGTGALARRRPRRAPAADPVGDRLRDCGFGHALHGDGRRDSVSACDGVIGRPGACRPTCSRSSSPSWRFAFPASFC